MKARRHILICSGTVWSIASSLGQTDDTILRRFDVLDIEQGLSQGMVSALAQDSCGFLWMCTKDGLNRYDGYTFRVFRHDQDNYGSVAENHTTQLLYDSRSRLWVGTNNSGLDLYDPDREAFRHMALEAGLGAPGGTTRIQEDPFGNVWASFVEVGCLLTTDLRSTSEMSEGDDPAFRPPHQLFAGLPDLRASRSWALDREARLWFTLNDSLHLYQLSNGPCAARKLFAVPLLVGRDLMVLGITGLTEDPLTGGMFFSYGSTLELLDPGTGSPSKRIELPQGRHAGLGTFRSGSGTIIQALHGTGYLEVDQEMRQGTIVNLSTSGSKGELPAAVLCYQMDRDGTQWMGTSGYGVLKRTRNQSAFNTIRAVDGSPMSVRGFLEDREGDLIVPMYDAEVFQRATWQRSSLRIATAYEDGLFEGLYSSIAEAGNGAIWFVSGYEMTLCLSAFDRSDGSVTRGTLAPHLAGVQFQPLRKGLDGRIWYGGVVGKNHVLCRLDEQSPENSACYEFPIAFREHRIPFISDIHFARDGTIWSGTLNGVFQLDPVSSSWRHYHRLGYESNSLGEDVVYSLCPDPDDPDGTLWVGTNGGGLFRMNMANGSCTRYGLEQGLPNEVVYGILSDAHHGLWLSTNNGLCLLDPRTGTTRTFTVDDGLQGNEFNRYAYLKMRDGTLVFGGVNGFNHFDPNEFYEEGRPSDVRVIGLRIMNRTVPVGALSSAGRTILEKPMVATRELTLDHSDRMITFSFACMDLTNPRRNRFRYLLEGFGTEWVEAGTDNEAGFTNLDQGTYSLRVQAMNSKGVWSEGDPIALTITPPWWGTWWFRVLLVVFIASLLYAWYRNRVQHLSTERNMALLETQALRSQMNPHFIFNALNSINAFVQQNDPDNATSFLTKFARVMRSVLENSRHSEVPLQDDLETLRSYMELERKRMGGAFDFSIEVDPAIDPEEVMVPPLVVQPFVENAIWHGMKGRTDKGHITLRVKQQGEQLLWQIEDDGAGRQAKQEPAPEATPDQPVKKTSLGTAITRSRLDLVQKQHGGKAGFHYEDLPKGTRVTVEMPLLRA